MTEVVKRQRPEEDMTLGLPVETLIRQVQKIQQVMSAVMKPGEHYGVVPGTGTKPSLLKPGAEKLGFVFRLAPRFTIQETTLERGHREYRVTCELTSLITGNFVAEGLGVCSTMEAKYRYRKVDRLCPECGQPTLLKSKQKPEWFCWAKKGGCGRTYPLEEPRIVEQQLGRIEHDNPSDYCNTVLKMAKKRAHVDAILTATAASDLFVQDVEDLAEVKESGTDPTWPGRQPPSAAFGGDAPDDDQAPWPEEAPPQEIKATPKKVALIPKEQAVRRAIGLCKLAATRAMIDPEEMAHKLFAKDGKLTNQQGIAMDWESWVKDCSERWLNETVLPALAKFIRSHPEVQSS